MSSGVIRQGYSHPYPPLPPLCVCVRACWGGLTLLGFLGICVKNGWPAPFLMQNCKEGWNLDFLLYSLSIRDAAWCRSQGMQVFGPIEIFEIFNEWIVILHWLQLFFGCSIGQDDGLWILGKKKKTIGFGEGGWPEACLNSVTSQSVPGHSSQPKAALLRRLLEWERFIGPFASCYRLVQVGDTRWDGQHLLHVQLNKWRSMSDQSVIKAIFLWVVEMIADLQNGERGDTSAWLVMSMLLFRLLWVPESRDALCHSCHESGFLWGSQAP